MAGKAALDVMRETPQKMSRYNVTEVDLLRENGHSFMDVAKLGLKHDGKCCLDCGIMRRVDRQNKPCKGPVELELRGAL